MKQDFIVGAIVAIILILVAKFTGRQLENI